MGLDEYIFMRAKDKDAKILQKLKGVDEDEQVLYWRKDYFVMSFFEENFEMDNCKEIILTKQNLIDFKGFLENSEEDYSEDIKILTKYIEETDFKRFEFFFYAWW